VRSEPIDSAEITHGSKIGRFVVEGQLGAGGMSVVFAAHDRQLDRRIAIKILRGTVDEAQRLRLMREGQAMARVTHPNVITVYEVGIEGRLVFLAQELLDGGTLREWLATPRTRREILDKFIAAGRGLAAAHAAGLVHRDFKPDNVLLGTDGRVRVADFGLARSVEGAETVPSGPHVDALAQTAGDLPMSPLTRTGAVMGTPLYMAPEQHLAEPVDARSDQFSFCVALYEALYGEQPFPGRTAVALADAVINGRLQRPPAGSSVPSRLRRILLRGLSISPADRYPTIDALLAELAHDGSRRMRRVALVGVLGIVIAGAVVGGYALRSRTATATDAVPAVRTIAVLGFKNLGGDSSTHWMASAAAELIASALSGDDVRVTPAEDTHRARIDLALPDTESFSDETLQRIRGRLGVDAIVVGSYLSSGGQVTLIATVQDIHRGRIERIEIKGRATDLPALAAQAGPQIRQALGIAPLREAKLVHAVLPRDPEAARTFIEGMAALRAFDFPLAKQHLLAATKREPDFAPGHLALANTYDGLFDGDAAKAAARKALETAKTLPVEQQLYITGQAYERLGEGAKAREQYRRLFALDPQLDYGLRLVNMQPHAEATATITALRKLAPDEPRIDIAESNAEMLHGNPQRSLELARQASTAARARNSRIVLADARKLEGDAQLQLAELDAAWEALDEARKLYAAAGDKLKMIHVSQYLAVVSLERGLYDDAFEKYDMAGALKSQAGQKVQASLAWAAASLVLTLSGRTKDAEARLRDAEAGQPLGHDQVANAYVDMAATVLALARHDPATGIARSKRCASTLAATVPTLAPLCDQLEGELLAEQGDAEGARKAYERGLANATKAHSLQRVANLELALAQLDLDEGRDEAVVTKATALQAEAAKRGARVVEAHAWLLLARARLAQAESQQALAILENVKPEAVQAFRVRVQYTITLGLVYYYLGDPDTALTMIDGARTEAEKASWLGLAFEARLARVEVLLGSKAEDALTEQQVLVRDASARGLGRIARLAQALAQH
jgi:tetratricopeptide (TPR) repeat protein